MRLLLALFAFWWIQAPAAIQLKLDTNTAPPYQLISNGEVTGMAVDGLACVMERLQIGYGINVVPWKRAQLNVRSGLSDGVFSVMRQPELEPYAQLSAPLVLEKWYWYSRDDALLHRNDFPGDLRIGVIRGSNQESWLEGVGLHYAQQVNQLDSLFKLLAIGRVDIILVDQQAMLTQQQLDTASLFRRFERYMPLGVYFSSSFLATQKEFLSKFNAQLAYCHGQGQDLTTDEAKILRQRVDKDFSYWRKNKLVQQLLQSAPGIDWELLSRDRTWQQVASTGQPFPAWMNEILRSPLSDALAEWQQRQQGQYTEVFISAANGQLLASSRLTSDYWQGDEEKLQQTLKQAKRDGPEILVGWMDRNGYGANGFIDYDPSSQQFISHLSYPLWYDGQIVAVMTFGIQVEEVLRHSITPLHH